MMVLHECPFWELQEMSQCYDGASNVKDYHPISIVNRVYKIITEVLATSMSMVTENIISTSQNPFVRGRQILDSVFFLLASLKS